MNKSLLLILAGVAAGILLAPRKGSETWEMIVDKLDEIKGEAADKASDFGDEAQDFAEKAERKGKKMARDVKDDMYSTQL